jgi:hypothetical protein
MLKSKKRIDCELEKLKTELAVEKEQVAEVFKLRLERLPSLVEAIYRSRNIARELVNDSSFQPDLRSRLGDLGLLVTEVRASLSSDLFERLHAYKTHLQQFIFEYDILTASSEPPPPELVASLNKHYILIDELHGSIVRDVQEVLHVSPERVSGASTR